MAVIAPQTDVFLLKVPLEINDLNQLTFADAAAQYNYFISLPKLEVTNFTYQRKDGTIRYGANFDDLLSYNYVMYRNDAYSSKWFYAFITGMEYLNDNVTAISIKTDVWQTWQFDLTFKACLIDREHTNDDTVGANTLPEDLELGEMVANGATVNFGGGGTGVNDQFYTIIEVSQIENRGTEATLSYSWVSGSHDATPKINDMERGTIPLIIGGTFAGHTSGAIRKPDEVTHLYDVAGLGESIVNMYMLPSSLVGTYNEIDLTATPNVGSVVTLDGIGIPTSSTGTTTIGTTQTFTKPTTVNGYTPKNGKLKTWPFMYFNISNNAGSSLPYRYEDFSTSVSFDVDGTFGVSGSVKCTPKYYLNMSTSDNAIDYSINGPKYPVCSWNSDSYTNWLTQNSVNMETQWKTALIHGGASILSSGFHGSAAATEAGINRAKGIAMGAGGAAIETGGGLIALAREQHLAKTQANLVSDQVKGNLGAGDYLWAKYRSPFTYQPMSIKAEYARCIDEYFSQFGYKCNRVKIPNITGRLNWNYVKTVGCYIAGDIPQGDMQEIKNMFDRGITLWHNPTTFADYSQANTIVTS